MKVLVEGMWTVGYRQEVFDALVALGHQRVAFKPDTILVMGDQKNVCLPHLLGSRKKKVIVLFPKQDDELCQQFRAMGAEAVVASTSELSTALTMALGG